MRGRKIVTARHCRRVPACVYPAIRDGWPVGAIRQTIYEYTALKRLGLLLCGR
jgi:hypothetical protein